MAQCNLHLHTGVACPFWPFLRSLRLLTAFHEKIMIKLSRVVQVDQ